MESDFLTITILKKIHKNEKINELANTLIVISFLIAIPILYYSIPTEFDRTYRFDKFIEDNIYLIIADAFLMLIGILVKLSNYKKVFGLVKFYKNKVELSDRKRKLVYSLENIEKIKYLFSNFPDESSTEKERHWISLFPKEAKEIYFEFLGDEVQMDLLKTLGEYKIQGHNIEIDTINK